MVVSKRGAVWIRFIYAMGDILYVPDASTYYGSSMGEYVPFSLKMYVLSQTTCWMHARTKGEYVPFLLHGLFQSSCQMPPRRVGEYVPFSLKIAHTILDYVLDACTHYERVSAVFAENVRIYPELLFHFIEFWLD